jgi:hypothetical protein
VGVMPIHRFASHRLCRWEVRRYGVIILLPVRPHIHETAYRKCQKAYRAACCRAGRAGTRRPGGRSGWVTQVQDRRSPDQADLGSCDHRPLTRSAPTSSYEFMRHCNRFLTGRFHHARRGWRLRQSKRHCNRTLKVNRQSPVGVSCGGCRFAFGGALEHPAIRGEMREAPHRRLFLNPSRALVIRSKT